MNLYWLEQVEADVPTRDDWLSRWETVRLEKFRFAKRRGDWRLGRWTAKQALAFCLNLDSETQTLATIEIRPAQSGVPEAFVNHRRAPVAISLSHRENRAMCVLAPIDVKVGCDLETVEPHSNAFIAAYFTVDEQQLVNNSSDDGRALAVSVLWSAKESALKALHEGLRLDTRTVNATFSSALPNTGGWGPLEVAYSSQVFKGWWQKTDYLVRTIVADAAPNIPICLPVNSVIETGFVSEMSALR